MKQSIDTSTITVAQLDACSRLIDLNRRTVFYLVESASEPGTEYRVQYNPVLKALECLPHTGKACQASEHGCTCWHKRAALKSAELRRIAQRAEMNRELAAGMAEMAAEDKAAYTVQVDPTSSSLDGIRWEICPASGRAVPMR
jgi:hypothetical protein